MEPTLSPTKDRAGARDARIEIALRLLAVALVTVGSLWKIGDRSLWIDEVITYDAVVCDWRTHLHWVYRVWDHPPLFFHIEWLLARISTSTVLLSAFPALCAAAASIVLAHDVAREGRTAIGRGTVFLFTAAVVAFNPPVQFQAWNLRHYGLWLLLAALYMTGSRRWIQSEGRPRWSLAPIWGGLALLTHHFSLFVLFAVELFILVRLFMENRRGFVWPIVRRTALLVPFVMAGAVMMWSQYPGSGGEKVGKLFGAFGWNGMWIVLGRTFGAPDYLGAPAEVLHEGIQIGRALVVGLLLLAVWRPNPRLAFWLCASLVPFACLFVISFHLPTMEGRLVLPCVAALWTAIACALASIPASVRLPIATLCVFLLGRSSYDQGTNRFQAPYQDIAPNIPAAMGRDDLLVLSPGCLDMLYDYYFRQSQIPLPAKYSVPAPVFGQAYYEEQLRQLPEVAGRFRRVWVLYEFDFVWEPTLATRHYFERNWIPREYQKLWGDRWVIAYYDNPAFAQRADSVETETTRTVASSE